MLFSVLSEGSKTHKELKPVGIDSDLIDQSLSGMKALPLYNATRKELAIFSSNLLFSRINCFSVFPSKQ